MGEQAYTIHARVFVYDAREVLSFKGEVYTKAEDLAGFALVHLECGASEVRIEDTNSQATCYARKARYVQCGVGEFRKELVSTLSAWEQV